MNKITEGFFLEPEGREYVVGEHVTHQNLFFSKIEAFGFDGDDIQEMLMKIEKDLKIRDSNVSRTLLALRVFRVLMDRGWMQIRIFPPKKMSVILRASISSNRKVLTDRQRTNLAGFLMDHTDFLGYEVNVHDYKGSDVIKIPAKNIVNDYGEFEHRTSSDHRPRRRR